MIEGMVRRFIKVGRLTLIEANGKTAQYGDGSGPEIVVRLKPGAAWRLARNPTLTLGECYMDGSLVLEKGGAYELLDLIGRNFQFDPERSHRKGLFLRIWFAILRQIQQVNDRFASQRNVAHHYDLSYDLYRRFLDPDMQYSCAYFAEPGMTLEEAQVAKKAHIAAKLLLEPGKRVLDIGCGWGGMGLTLAESAPGAEVLGITLSKEQLAVAQRRARERGLDNRVRFDLCDYRDVQGPFDRIVSVGMFEHVGRPNYQAYFDRIAELLTDDGVALVHSIGRKDEPSITNPFIAKYIFPGGYIPALSEVLPCIERAGLWVTDMEILRLHYAETLREWRRRFLEQHEEIKEIYDAAFCRMWEFYLASSEIAFRYAGHMNFQVQLSKRVDAAPITRDYMGEAERALLSPAVAARTAAE